MKVLITNDDGIHAPGMFALYRALKAEYEVHIVAPETEMSAVGHAITLSLPLRVQPVRKEGTFYGYAVNGTPADCVKIAVKELMDEPPDIILSGINLGRNVGVDIIYSGTVSAATEGAFLGFPSAAVSLDTRESPEFDFPARFSRQIIRFLASQRLKDGTALNVNIPAVPADQVTGVCFTRQGTSRFDERFERRKDPRGNTYYWLSGETFLENGGLDDDATALRRNMITITPIQYELTSRDELERLKNARPVTWDIS